MKATSMIRFLAAGAAALVMSVTAYAAETTAKTEATEMPLAEARAKIGDVLGENAKVDTAAIEDIMRKLNATNQVQFVASLNAAINQMPGSEAEKAATAVVANRAAVQSASSENTVKVVATVYASASVSSLPAITENFGSTILNRAGDPSVTYTDAQFTDLSKSIVGEVSTACASSDSSDVRTTFAIVTMVNGSNGTIPDLGSLLADSYLSPESATIAKSDWIPGATGSTPSYESLLAAAGIETGATTEQVMPYLAGIDPSQAGLIISIDMGTASGSASTPGALSVAFANSFADAAMRNSLSNGGIAGGNTIPVTPTIQNAPWSPNVTRGEVTPENLQNVTGGNVSEPTGYAGQTL